MRRFLWVVAPVIAIAVLLVLALNHDRLFGGSSDDRAGVETKAVANRLVDDLACDKSSPPPADGPGSVLPPDRQAELRADGFYYSTGWLKVRPVLEVWAVANCIGLAHTGPSAADMKLNEAFVKPGAAKKLPGGVDCHSTRSQASPLELLRAVDAAARQLMAGKPLAPKSEAASTWCEVLN